VSFLSLIAFTCFGERPGIELNGGFDNLTRIISEYRIVRRLFLSFVPACFLLAGCGSALPIMDVRHPEGPAFDTFVDSVAQHVRCELGRAIKANVYNDPKRLAILRSWAAKIALNLKVVDEGSVNPTVAVFNAPQSFVFSAAGQYKGDATREMTMTYFLLLSELIDEPDPDALDANHLPVPCRSANDGFAPIGGQLGIEQTLESSLKSWDSMYVLSDRVKGGPFDTITHHVQFLVVAGATATPTWKLVRFSADTSGSLLGLNRTMTDDLLITMGPTQLGSRKVAKGYVRSTISSQELNETFFTERLRTAIRPLGN